MSKFTTREQNKTGAAGWNWILAPHQCYVTSGRVDSPRGDFNMTYRVGSLGAKGTRVLSPADPEGLGGRAKEHGRGHWTLRGDGRWARVDCEGVSSQSVLHWDSIVYWMLESLRRHNQQTAHSVPCKLSTDDSFLGFSNVWNVLLLSPLSF